MQVYYVKAKKWPELEPDSLEQEEYRGSIIIVADRVHPAVGSKDLAAWLQRGLDDDDPDYVATKVGLAEAQKELAKTVTMIESLPTMRIQVWWLGWRLPRCAAHEPRRLCLTRRCEARCHSLCRPRT